MIVFEKTILSTREASRALISEAMDYFAHIKKKGYARGVSKFNMRLVMDEALENAIRHGNGLNNKKTVTVRITGHKTKIEFIIQDQGNGFLPDQVPDPLKEENRFAPSGRGLLLLSNIAFVKWNNEGNCVSIELSR